MPVGSYEEKMKFSVLLPTKNRLEYLKFAIDSVLTQKYPNWEIIVSDNYSEQNIKEYVSSLNEPRICYSRTTRSLSVTENWNETLDRCTGDYVVMLGDDDALINNYFESNLALLNKYNFPDLIYCKSYQYVYPEVIPGKPEGYLIEWGNAGFLEQKNDPFVMKKSDARFFANQSLKFKAHYMYNMQFGLFSRGMIDKIKMKGPFFQSPYPDYYAMTSLFLHADRILAVPKPMVIVGICPKSFGYYYFNLKEKEGMQFLDNTAIPPQFNHLKKYFMPGPKMNTCWLLAMESVRINFGKKYKLRVHYFRYRFIQILDCYRSLLWDSKEKPIKLEELKLYEDMYWWEKILFSIPFSILEKKRKDSIRKNQYSDFQKKIFDWIVNFTHPSNSIRFIDGNFKDISDVFKQVT
jgi:glycosyltransferase involved in cell wall biosynthesis